MSKSNNIPVDILDTPRVHFYMDEPGLSKSDIIHDENTLVIKSAGKRKREDGDEEACKYIRLERKTPQKLLRKFRLPENAIVSSAITAKCETGFLPMVVEKHPPPPETDSCYYYLLKLRRLKSEEKI